MLTSGHPRCALLFLALAAPAWGQALFSPLGERHLPVADGLVSQVVPADLDGGGDLDLVQATEKDTKILLNDGRAWFTAARRGSLPQGETSSSLALGDLLLSTAR